MEIKIKIEATGLEKAILALAGALQGVQTLPVAEAAPQTETVKEKKETPAKETTKTKSEEAPKETKADEAPKETESEEVEEKATTPGLTFEQVRIKLAEVSQKGKQKELKALITSMGAEKLSDIPEEQYAELLEKASEL